MLVVMSCSRLHAMHVTAKRQAFNWFQLSHQLDYVCQARMIAT